MKHGKDDKGSREGRGAALRAAFVTAGVLIALALPLPSALCGEAAHLSPHQQQLCEELGDKVRGIAMARDEGDQREQVIDALSGYFVTLGASDKEAHHVASGLVNRIYDSPAPPTEAAAAFVAGCEGR